MLLADLRFDLGTLSVRQAEGARRIAGHLPMAKLKVQIPANVSLNVAGHIYGDGAALRS